VFDANGLCDTAFKAGSAVLMARVVDSAGEAVRRADIEAVRYSIREFDGCPLDDDLAAAAGHEAVALNVDDVFFDSLQTGGPWTVDDVGYNFRHEIGVGGDKAFPRTGTRYEVRYELTPTCGAKTFVRFQLKVI
jgi:hypothetical protein